MTDISCGGNVIWACTSHCDPIHTVPSCRHFLTMFTSVHWWSWHVIINSTSSQLGCGADHNVIIIAHYIIDDTSL